MYRFKSVGVALSPARVSHFRLDAVIFLLPREFFSFILIIESSHTHGLPRKFVLDITTDKRSTRTVFDNWYRLGLCEYFFFSFFLFPSNFFFLFFSTKARGKNICWKLCQIGNWKFNVKSSILLLLLQKYSNTVECINLSL